MWRGSELYSLVVWPVVEVVIEPSRMAIDPAFDVVRMLVETPGNSGDGGEASGTYEASYTCDYATGS